MIRLNSLTGKRFRVFKRNKIAMVGAIMALLIILVSVFSEFIAPFDPLEQQVDFRFLPPSSKFLLGTDYFGRDILSRIIWGSRVSLSVGIGSIFIGLVIGSFFGIIAAYVGGKTSNFIMRAVDITMCFPSEVFAILVLFTIGQGLWNLIITIGILMAPRFARLSYGNTLALKERDFIEASRALGATNSRIILRHILPNVSGELLVISSLWTAVAIRIEANLSFLGLGVPPPTPTWGNMVRLGTEHLTNAPWMSVIPGIAIMLAILSFNLLGDGLRDATDPKLYD